MNESSDYVFKSSKVMVGLAIQMDVKGPENMLQEENAYFDATHTRVHGFKSLGLWLFHPTMRKVFRLASMDLRTEHSKDIALFFTLLNEMLQKVRGKPDHKFNPCYFLCDEGGANHKAIKIVYGEDFCKEGVVGCQWHFRSDVNKKSKKLPEDMGEIFNKICKELCKSTTTTSQYNLLKAQLEEMAHTTALDQMVRCQMLSHFCPF